MERNLPNLDWYGEQKKMLVSVFGEGAIKLLKQITHDNDTLTNEQAVEYAWVLIKDLDAFDEPKDTPEARTRVALDAHQGYEALRRVAD